MSTDVEIEHGIKIIPIEGKGNGIVACRPFSRGDIVFSEKPLFVQPHNATALTISKALSNCSPAEQREFFSLHNCHQSVAPFMGIFKTNCLPCGQNDEHTSAEMGGLFLVGSRFNSSCVGNINNRWSKVKGILEFRALRPISVGEELCITYTSPVAERAIRQRDLKAKFGFTCACEACALKGTESKQSDARRRSLDHLVNNGFARAFRRIGPEDILAEAFEGLRLVKREKLFVYEWHFYFDGFEICAKVSDWENAKKWAGKAYEASCAVYGEEISAEEKGYMENPQTFKLAGTLPKRKLKGPDSATSSSGRKRR